jgi:hypothetical protein
MSFELGDLLAVDVDHHHVVSEVGEAGRSGQTDVAGANDRDLAQAGPIIS